MKQLINKIKGGDIPSQKRKRHSYKTALTEVEAAGKDMDKCLEEDPSPKKVSNYTLKKELANALKAALISGRPLLVKGGPGMW